MLIQQVITKLNEGGPFFTYPILVFIVCILLVFIWALKDFQHNEKQIAILKQLGWLSVAWGFLGRTFGLIVAFDTLREYSQLTPQLLGDGLKMAILGPMLGIVAFIIARIFLLFLYSTAKTKKQG